MSRLRLESALVLISTIFCAYANIEGGDPSSQELDMFDWTSGLRVAYCTDSPLPDMISPFRRAMAKVVTKYCLNTTACNLKKHVIFNAEHIAFLDGFPRREFGSLHLKFYVILPHDTNINMKQQRPLLPRAVLSDVLRKHITELSNRLGWSIISYEKYPRFDSMTEFMNIAIIPIVIFSVPLMIFLAYWTSTLRPNMGSEAWMVTGSTGGKNAALRRTMEIIAEQNREIERQNQVNLTRHIEITGTEGLANPSAMLLNVARLSFASADPNSPIIPPMIVYPSTSQRKESSTTPPMLLTPPNLQPTPSSHLPQHLLQKPKSNRRQSSVDEIKQYRAQRNRRKSVSSAQPQKKRWKTGSMIFGGFNRDRL